jgi:hypothetical protein
VAVGISWKATLDQRGNIWKKVKSASFGVGMVGRGSRAPRSKNYGRVRGVRVTWSLNDTLRLAVGVTRHRLAEGTAWR